MTPGDRGRQREDVSMLLPWPHSHSRACALGGERQPKHRSAGLPQLLVGLEPSGLDHLRSNPGPAASQLCVHGWSLDLCVCLLICEMGILCT